MGLRIVERHRSSTFSEERSVALAAEANRWAQRKLGDTKSLTDSFLAKVADIRKLDTLNGSITKKATELGIEIRAHAELHIHDERAFDLQRILGMI